MSVKDWQQLDDVSKLVTIHIYLDERSGFYNRKAVAVYVKR